MVSELEVTGVNEVGVKVRVKAPAVPVITRLVKVATPETAATVVVPESVPLPEAIDATTLTLELVTVLPLASTMRITGWVARVDPLAAPVGCVVIADADAEPVAVELQFATVVLSQDMLSINAIYVPVGKVRDPNPVAPDGQLFDEIV